PGVGVLLLARLAALGARLARPGEFSERAFVNRKLGLAQAEAIADLISAGSGAAARSALRSLEGGFARGVRALPERLTRLSGHGEAAIDFPEEEIDFLGDARIAEGLDRLEADLDALTRDARQGQLLQAGLTLVLAGPPNAGK